MYIDLKLHIHLHVRLRPSYTVGKIHKFRSIFSQICSSQIHADQREVAHGDFKIAGQSLLIESDDNPSELQSAVLVAAIHLMQEPECVVRPIVWLHALDECPLSIRQIPSLMTIELPLPQYNGETGFSWFWPFRGDAKVVNSSIENRTEMVSKFID